MLGFRWSKKAKITLETISFWQNISISIFKFSSFLYTMKTGRWNLINFSKFASALIRKEKKQLRSSQWERKTDKFWTLFYNRLFCKVLWYDNESFFLFHQLIHSPIVAFGYQHDARNIKSGSMERQIARQTANYKSNFNRLIMNITQTNLFWKPMDWFLYARDLRHERFKTLFIYIHQESVLTCCKA